MNDSLFDGTEAFRHLQVLAQEIGPRASGSENERKAAEYIAGQLREFGLSVRIDSFPVTIHRQKRTELWALDGEPYRINCAAQQFAANTPDEGVEGDLVFVETAHPQYLEDRFRDKIWLIFRGLPSTYYGMAMTMKPRAIINVEAQMGVLPKRTHLRRSFRDHFGTVPTIRISFEDGMRLIREGVRRARIVTQGEEEPSESRNVVAELPGSDEGSEIVLVCAHIDSVRHVAGAGDNASGTSILIELARELARYGTKRTFRFVGFGSEEIGLRGSTHYARTLWEHDQESRKSPGFIDVFDKTELQRHALCVNLDMHGVTLGTNICRSMGPPELLSAVKLLSAEMGPAFASIQESIFSSDGMCLAAVGVPGVAFARVGGSTVVTHSRADTIEYLDADHLAMIGRFIEVLLKRYAADAFVFPFPRQIPQGIRDQIKDYFKYRVGEGFPPVA
jgi:putative aminopeptidase FrvX